MQFANGLLFMLWILFRLLICGAILMPIAMLAWLIAKSWGAEKAVKALWDWSLELIWYDMVP